MGLQLPDGLTIVSWAHPNYFWPYWVTFSHLVGKTDHFSLSSFLRSSNNTRKRPIHNVHGPTTSRWTYNRILGTSKLFLAILGDVLSLSWQNRPFFPFLLPKKFEQHSKKTHTQRAWAYDFPMDLQSYLGHIQTIFGHIG